jgi:hypothetical protein
MDRAVGFPPEQTKINVSKRAGFRYSEILACGLIKVLIIEQDVK